MWHHKGRAIKPRGYTRAYARICISANQSSALFDLCRGQREMKMGTFNLSPVLWTLTDELDTNVICYIITNMGVRALRALAR